MGVVQPNDLFITYPEDLDAVRCFAEALLDSMCLVELHLTQTQLRATGATLLLETLQSGPGQVVVQPGGPRNTILHTLDISHNELLRVGPGVAAPAQRSAQVRCRAGPRGPVCLSRRLCASQGTT